MISCHTLRIFKYKCDVYQARNTCIQRCYSVFSFNNVIRFATSVRRLSSDRIANDGNQINQNPQQNYRPSMYQAKPKTSQTQYPISIPGRKESSLNIISRNKSVTFLESKRVKVREDIEIGRQTNNASLIIEAIIIARQLGIKLTMREYMHGLWACSVTNNDSCQEAFYIFEQLKLCDSQELLDSAGIESKNKIPIIPSEAFANVLKICRKYGYGHTALQIIDNFEAMKLAFTEEIYIELLFSLTRNFKDLFFGKIQHYYALYYRDSFVNGWKVNFELMQEVAIALSYSDRRATDVVKILREITENGFEPTAKFCKQMFLGALTMGEVTVLNILCSWYVLNFDEPLEEGYISRISQIAVIKVDLVLAKLSVQLAEKLNIGNLKILYYSYAIVCINRDDTVTLLEVLLEAESKGFDFYKLAPKSTPWPMPIVKSSGLRQQNEKSTNLIHYQTYGDTLRDLLAKRMTTRLSIQDDLYFILVDLVRNNFKVPKLVLDAIILAAGSCGKSDRSFATFQELESLFCVKPDVHTYNGLLMAALYHVDSVNPVFQILEQMETSSIQANRLTYSLIFEKMIETNDFHGYDEIMKHIRSASIIPKPRTLRRLAISFLSSNDISNKDRLTECLILMIYDKKYPTITKLLNDRAKNKSKQNPAIIQDQKLELEGELDVNPCSNILTVLSDDEIIDAFMSIATSKPVQYHRTATVSLSTESSPDKSSNGVVLESTTSSETAVANNEKNSTSNNVKFSKTFKEFTFPSYFAKQWFQTLSSFDNSQVVENFNFMLRNDFLECLNHNNQRRMIKRNTHVKLA